MKKIIYLICFLTLQIPLYSQSLSGIIKSDIPISFASISVKGQSIGTASNADGFFEINDIKEGSYEFVFSAIGFKKLKKNL
ncbi:MAG: carboxypeptidase-like regulatory domain-containing protein, partial [Flavobacteriales bacterium]